MSDHKAIAKERSDWLLDAVACATQDRRFLRGEKEYDEVAGEAILLNAEKAIQVAIDRAALSSDGKTAGPPGSAERVSASEPPSSPVAGGGEEMKPCPFCGGTDAEPEADRLQGTKWGRVVCRSCGACGEEVRTDYDTSPDAEWRTEAVAAWNRRSPLLSSPRVEEVRRLREALERIAWNEPVGTPAQREADAALSPPQGE